MCKFFILGSCTKGAQCNFAHDRVELSSVPDLAKTKLCKTLINTGTCDDPNCTYAHNKEELRHVPGFNSQFQVMEPPKNSQQTFSGVPLRHGAASFRAVGHSPGFGSMQPEQQQQQQQQQLAFASELGKQMAVGANQPLSWHHQACDDPSFQQLFTNAWTEAMMVQFGEAAQAHAAEALRLNAIAARLQAGGGNVGQPSLPSSQPTLGINSSPAVDGAMSGGSYNVVMPGGSEWRTPAVPSLSSPVQPRGHVERPARHDIGIDVRGGGRGVGRNQTGLKELNAQLGATSPSNGVDGHGNIISGLPTRRGTRGGKNRTGLSRTEMKNIKEGLLTANNALSSGGQGHSAIEGARDSMQSPWQEMPHQALGAPYTTSPGGPAAASFANAYFGAGDVAGGGLVGKNTILPYDANMASRVRTADSQVLNSERCNEFGQQITVGNEGYPATAHRQRSKELSDDTQAMVRTMEPVQINPGTLRSMSSQSLTALDPCAEEEDDPLEDLIPRADMITITAEAAAGPSRGAAPCGGEGATSNADGGFARWAGDGSLFSGASSQIQVKNTFVDFGSEERPLGKLRAVHTAAGRLDLMGGCGLGEE
jgi:hypothetical protein